MRDGEFINITILADDNVAVSVKVLFLLPAVAGVGLLVLQGTTKHPVRGIVILFLAILPVLLTMTDMRIMGIASVMEKYMPADEAVRLMIMFLGLFVAPIALLVAVRSRGYRPNSQTAYWFGTAGAAAWFMFLLTPALPAQQGHIFLMLPIKMIGAPNLGSLSMGLMVLMVSWSIAAIICIINRPTDDDQKARSQASLAYWTILAGFVVLMLCMAGQFLGSFEGIIASIKFLCCFGGIALMIPTGITDLVVGHIHHHRQHPHDHHDTANYHTEPPDIPKRIV